MKNNKYFIAIFAIIFGLMPFNPPHIIGKINWLFGGGAIEGEHPMKTMDWIDLFQHGIPLLFGTFYLLFLIFKKEEKVK